MFKPLALRTSLHYGLLVASLSTIGCTTEPPDSEAIRSLSQESRRGGSHHGHSDHHQKKAPQLTRLGSSYSGVEIGKGGAEIVAHDPQTQRLFVSNADARSVDVLDVSDPENPLRLEELHIDITPYGAQVNSVAVSNGVVAAAIEASPKQAPGVIAFFNTDGVFLSQVTVGSLPDMVAFTPNGKTVVVANEGEPNSHYGELESPDRVDPEGSISIIDVRKGVKNLTQAKVRTADFAAFNGAIDPGVRISGPGATTVAQDLEPEYITISPDSRTAWVTLQENNAIAEVDLRHAEVLDIIPLGFKDHSLSHNGLDASDKDDAINIATYPVRGLYMPDAIASYVSKGKLYTITANEGDAREYGDEDDASFYIDEEKCGKLTLDPIAFPDAAWLQEDEYLGRLRCITTEGDIDNDGDYDELYSFGARSFSIRDASGNLVFDSGDSIEQTIAALLPYNFNATDDDPEAEDRSDNKGPEPEGVVVGKLRGRSYAFIGLERIGGIMVYDVTDPTAPTFEQYINTRNFETDVPEEMGDLAPEGMIFIKPCDSPNKKALLVVAFETSATTTIFQFD